MWDIYLNTINHILIAAPKHRLEWTRIICNYNANTTYQQISSVCVSQQLFILSFISIAFFYFFFHLPLSLFNLYSMFSHSLLPISPSSHYFIPCPVSPFLPFNFPLLPFLIHSILFISFAFFCLLFSLHLFPSIPYTSNISVLPTYRISFRGFPLPNSILSLQDTNAVEEKKNPGKYFILLTLYLKVKPSLAKLKKLHSLW